jgi:ABC-type bacteriocin/lantibiotic exporter with double-glycine peptidase domain
MKRKKRNKELFNIAVLTLITVVTWIGFDIYRTLNKKSKVQVAKSQLESINSRFDIETIKKVKAKNIISQQELDSVPEFVNLEFKKQVKEINQGQEATNSTEASPSAENIQD